MTNASLPLMLGLLLLWLVACTDQQTPSQIPTPVSTLEPDAPEDHLIRHATGAYQAFNQKQWNELYGYLAPSVQQQCSPSQFGAWMELGLREPALGFFEPDLFAYGQGYAGIVEDSGLALEWESSRTTVQGNEGLVYKKTVLSRLGQTISSVEAEEPDRWKLVGGRWRWELSQPESTELTLAVVCRMVASIPTPTLATVPDQPGYAWANPADLGTPLTLDDEVEAGTFTVRITPLEVLRGDEVRQLLIDPRGSMVSPIAGFEYLMARLQVEHVEGPSPDKRYSLDDADFWAASSDGRYYAQTWMVGVDSPDLLAQPPELAIGSVDSSLGLGQAHEGWVGFLVAVDDSAPLLTYRPWGLEGHTVATPPPWWRLSTQETEVQVLIQADCTCEDYLPCRSEPSGILLKNIRVRAAIAAQRFINLRDSESGQPFVNPGEQIIVVSGQVENDRGDRPFMSISASGYDQAGNLVSWTLDESYIWGVILLVADPGEAKNFTLHLMFADNVDVIKLSACAYNYPPP